MIEKINNYEIDNYILDIYRIKHVVSLFVKNINVKYPLTFNSRRFDFIGR